MDFMKHKNQNISVDKPIDKVFSIIQKVGKDVGKIEEVNIEEKFIVVDIHVKLLSLKEKLNPTTIKISLFKEEENQTRINLFAVSQDGSVGFNSPQQSIDRFIDSLKNHI